jgi:hypothetical protein
LAFSGETTLDTVIKHHCLKNQPQTTN